MMQSIDDVTDYPRAQDRQCSPTANFVFVGERRSATAIVRGLQWEDGRLSARTLHDALSAIGLDPRTQHFLNLFRDDTPGVIDSTALDQIRSLAREGWVIVAMGRIVQEGSFAKGWRTGPWFIPPRGVPSVLALVTGLTSPAS
ncbi:MAG TPA: hypothetical protein VNF73_04615 [Candidatus Saccharimonadales bacterium]|nr:hypothetical protein [Candidatus Saccharimonadales bacterium]HVC32781.1 hypothetical protein [Chloroflexota bacterium]